MYNCCANCKYLRFLGEDRLYPYRCRKEKSGITHSPNSKGKLYIMAQMEKGKNKNTILNNGGEQND